jgi:hypothetical protein
LQRASGNIYQSIMPKKGTAPPRKSASLFNPLDKKQLAASVGEALLTSDLHPLPPAERFSGAGVYAIYYFGSSEIYSKLTQVNSASECPAPIYVGKAIPTGARKGDVEFDATAGYALFSRLNEHADSIRQVKNLTLSDFKCRFLVVDDIWIPLGESLLIRQFRPLWNIAVDGFGNHDPGSGRHKQKRSPWDVIHPGRQWAERLAPCAKSLDQITKEIGSRFG